MSGNHASGSREKKKKREENRGGDNKNGLLLPVSAAFAVGAIFAIWKLVTRKKEKATTGPGKAWSEGGNEACVGRFGEDAPGINVRFDLSPAAILATVDMLIGKSKEVHDQVASVPLDEVSYETVIAPLAALEAEEFPLAQACEFPSMVSPSKAVRDASRTAEKRLHAYGVKCSMRPDVYAVIKAYSLLAEPLPPEDQRYVDRLLRDRERLGLHLGEDIREEVERLKIRVGELSMQFQKNLNENRTVLRFREEDLAGLPPAFIESLKRGKDGRLKVTMEYVHYFPIMKQCKVSETRRVVERAFNRRCIQENTILLEEMVQLRHDIAAKLGYETHAHFQLDVRMAKTPAKVEDFLNRLSARVSAQAGVELTKLKDLKMKEEGAGEFGMSDFRYYMSWLESQEFRVDEDTLREYLPLQAVTDGMLRIYERLLDLEFLEVKNPHAWHKDVQFFSVQDGSTKQLMGYFYLDLHPREGKYSQACACPLQHSCQLLDGTRQLPVAAMLASFARPSSDGKPTLLQHSEVVTFFHEFGHLMHNICSRTKFAIFSGTRVERDFVEAPCQMLENWCWEKEPLQMMCRHYQTGKPLPADICQDLLRTRQSTAALLVKRQLLFALFDQTIHSQRNADTAAIVAELHPKVMMGIPMAKDTNFGANFGHLAGGYSAIYYGYMWSEVFSADMFVTKFKGRILDREVGLEFRRKIFEVGGSRDAEEQLRDFLGRPPTEDAFLAMKGLDHRNPGAIMPLDD